MNSLKTDKTHATTEPLAAAESILDRSGVYPTQTASFDPLQNTADTPVPAKKARSETEYLIDLILSS